MRLLCDGFRWISPAATAATSRHDVVVLDQAAIDRAWSDPRPDWWRDAVPAGWVPDVALFTCPEYHRAPPLLGELPFPVALWVGDWYADPQALGWIADQVDLVLADATGVAALRRAGIDHVDECCPWTFDPALHRPDWDAPPQRDIGFAGSLNDAIQHERNRWLIRLAALPRAISVEIRDDRYGEELVRFTQRSRITFNHSLTGDVNMRCFEAAACGSVVLVDAGAAEQVGRWFDLGREAVVYDDRTLEQVIVDLLRDDDRRQTIARAGWERVQQHGPHGRMGVLLGHLEALARAGRRPGRAAGPDARGRSAAYGLSVGTATADVLAGLELLLDEAEGAAPASGAVQVHRARLYAALAQSGAPQAALAAGWAQEHVDRAIELDPGDAVGRLTEARLHARRGDAAASHAVAAALAADIDRGAAVARADRVAIDEPLAARIARQRALLDGGDPEPALTRDALVSALRQAASTCEQPAARLPFLERALEASGDDAAVRLELAVCLLSARPEAILPHSARLVAERPLNAAGWILHAYALVAVGRRDAAVAFTRQCDEIAASVRIDPALMHQLRAAAGPVGAAATPAPG